MNYYDETNFNGLCQEIDSICGTNSTNYQLADKNRRLNAGLDEYFHISMKVCGDWSAEDSGNTDFAIATTNIVANQTDYSFPSDLLVLDRVEAKDSAGNWTLLEPIIEKEINEALDEYRDVSGTINQYRKAGNSLFVYPVSDSNITAGLKIYYRRAFDYSTVSGTTFTPAVPGIPSIHHMWLARKAALPYLVEKGKDSKNDITSLIAQGTEDIKDYYTGRQKDKQLTIRPIYRSSR